MYRYNDVKPKVFSGPLASAGALRLLSLVSLVLALNGCTAVGPDFVTPEADLQKNWLEAGNPRVETQTVDVSRWWRVFDDPALNQLIQLAYQQNLPLQIAGLRILQARAQLGIAIGQQYPQQQEAFGSATGVRISENAANSFGANQSFFDYQLGFDTAWELDFWGRFRRGVEAADASLTASVADYDNALVSLTAEVARTYAVIRTVEVLIQLARKNAQLQERGLQIADVRFRNGATTQLDVTQARTLLESTLATIPQRQASLRQAQNALSTLLGQPPGAVQALLGGPHEIPTAPTAVTVGVPAELLRRRPDIRSAELNAAAQSATIGIAEADLYPSFSLVGDLGLQTSSQGGIQSGEADLSDFFKRGSFFYSFGPGFRWPIFNYGRLKNNVRVQDALFQQLLVNYQNTVLTAAQEVEDALIGFLKAQEATAYLQNAVNAAQRSVELALTQYREGAVDYQRVLDTQRSLLQEENNLAETRSSIATNLIALYKALGGGWELREGQPIVAESTQAAMQQRTDWGGLLPPPPAPDTLNPPPPAREIPVLQKPDW